MRQSLVILFLAACGIASGQTPEELIGRLTDPDAAVRRISAEQLGKKKIVAAIPGLRDLIKDKNASVREAATAALIRFGPKGAAVVRLDSVNFEDACEQVYNSTSLTCKTMLLASAESSFTTRMTNRKGSQPLL